MSEFLEHPSVLIGVLTLALIYIGAAVRLQRRPTRRQALIFVAALLTILFAVSGPLDELADNRLFVAHMFQHLVLGLVMPPLLLLGVPDWMMRPLLGFRGVKRTARFLTTPIIAYTLYNGFIAVMHTVPVYELMVTNDDVHIALHIIIMVTGTIMWWPLLSPLPELPRLAYPSQTLYMFFLLIPMAAVSAPIALARHVIYPWYAAGPHPWGLAPLADQELGGLLMWVGGGIYFMCIFSVMFFRWAAREDRDEPLVGRPLATGAVRVI